MALSLRAIIALAARAARRVQPLFSSDDPQHIAVIDAAIQVAEAFATAENTPIDSADSAARAADAVAHAARAADTAAHAANAAIHVAHAAHGAARAAHAAPAGAVVLLDTAHYALYDTVQNALHDAFLDAFHDTVHDASRAIADAIRGGGKRVRLLILIDLGRLLRLSPISNGLIGEPVDFSALGPLWPDGQPEWLRGKPATETVSPDALNETAPPLRLYFDLSEVSPQEIARILGQLSSLYQDCGGDRLVIDDTTVLDLSEILLPVEG